MCRQYLDSSLLSEAVQTAPAKADESQNEDGYKEIFDTLSSFLNTESGLSYSMGKKDFYLNSLKSFSKNGQIELMKEAYEKKDMPEYKIHVHALKGVARLIGADDLSAKAKALDSVVPPSIIIAETAGRRQVRASLETCGRLAAI